MKKALTLILVIVMVFGLVACTQVKDETSTSPSESATTSESVAPSEPAVAQEATVCVGSEPATLDPNMNESVDGMIYITHLYEGLYRINTDGTFSFGQASDVQFTDNADGTCHVVATLRDDITWSDGTPVTANDFVYSWRRLCDPATGSSYGYIGQNFFANGAQVADESITPDQLSVTAVDDKTLEFDIAANVPYAKELMAFPSLMPLREDIVSANPEGWAAEAEGQVFNGRYTLTEFAHEDQMVMEKRDDYWDAATTNMTKLTFKLMSDDNAMYAAFQAGDLDMIDTYPADEIDAVRALPEYKQYGQIGLYYLEIQQIDGGAEVLKDVNVRKALSLAIDREYLNEQVWGGARIPAYALVPYGIQDAGGPGTDFRETAGEVVGGDMSADYEANVAKAKELLAEAGYADGVGFPKLELSYNTSTGHQAVAEAVMQSWQENLGITVELASMEWDIFQAYRKTSDCEVARQGWVGDYADPATFFDLFTVDAGTNDGHYNSAEYDALVNGARTESDPATRMQMYHDAEAILMNDMPIIPIVYYADDVLSQTYFSGFGVTGTGDKMFWGATITE